jgi:hypothetical protein
MGKGSLIYPGKMKKILLTVLGVFFFVSWCFAQNYYACVEILIKNDKGSVFSLNTITRVFDSQACEKILHPINLLKDKYQVKTECVSGPEGEKLFGNIFANQPTEDLYVSYKDFDGYETRISTKAQAVENPGKEIINWAKAMIKALEKGGIKNAKIIYPVKK